MTAPINNVFFADPQGLAALRKDAKAEDPAALKEAAKQFESLFTQMLLKSMREANKSFGDSMFGSDQADFYQDMFDDQMAVHLAQGKGLGLADMLVRQLTQAQLARPEAGDRGLGVQKSGPESVSELQAPASSVQPVATSRAEFIRSMLPHAERAARELGVDPHALVAQAALETGWGNAVPNKATGQSSFNLFGIKAGADWRGQTVNVPTLEFEDGVAVRRVERFRAYATPAESFADYATLIGTQRRYEGAVGAGQDVTAFAAALQQGGYATDPNYARKLVAVTQQVKSLAGSSTDSEGA